SWPNAAALVNGQAADLVLGQPNFQSTTPNAGGRSARSLYSPFGVVVNTQGDVYVADRDNHRVLEYDTPLSSGMPASHVFGQGGSFTTGAANNGGVSANSLNQPRALALDGQGHLYVADASNHRVLEYDQPLLTDQTADRVFGQQNFGSNSANQGGGASATDLNTPLGVALDPAGNLYVTDPGNNRVLEFNDPLTADHSADRVFGQPTFTANTANNGGLDAGSLDAPQGVLLDSLGRLYVSDYLNNRVLEFDAPLSSDHIADRVFGQPNFTTGTVNTGGLSAESLNRPIGMALDAQGNLYVADISNYRMLEYDQPVPRLDVFLPLVER
ncbi:MAG: NHL repeat-containing protein, partial [Anaerolineales bacterium]